MAYWGRWKGKVRKNSDPIIARRDAMNTTKASTPLRSMLIRAKRTARLPRIMRIGYVTTREMKNKTETKKL